ncbi:MAG: PQQ-binding-like beta-propeller repeat protein, partial [Pirellulaceae bacterium]|nr:PQQ-binding-like beta-propeller repeat protein [Pirellulaceae bacterium]
MRKWAIGVGAVTAAIAAVAAWWLTSPGRAEVHVVWKAELEGADTAAPLTADLNGDNVQDVIVAAGIEEKFGRVTAYNGPDGEPLWSVDLRDEALLALPATDVNKDGAAEIFIGTRKDERDFRAVDGRNGTTLWRLTEANPDRKFPPVNFICGVELNDVNADGLNDVLVVQSGGRDDLRVPGQFYVVNSANGEVLQSHVTPDQRECYAAPVFQVQQEEQFLYLGTGGETLKGHVVKLRFPEFEEVWRVSTDDVLARTDDAAVYPKPAGFVATPLLVDLDGDGDLEIVAALLDGPLVCLDAGTGEIRWTTSLGG